MKACLVAGGTLEDAFLQECLRKEQYDITIAVDRGLDFFYRMGICPNYAVGDFDSASNEALSYFEAEAAAGRKNPVMEHLNPMKDDTDTEHALHMALQMNCDKIHIYGATGSRLDHVLGNLQLLGYGMRADCECMLVDAHNRIRLIDKETILKKKEQFGTYVSLIPYTPRVEGLTLEGFLYPLNDHTMSCFYLEDAARISGISNEIIEDTARITFEEGILVLVESRD